MDILIFSSCMCLGLNEMTHIKLLTRPYIDFLSSIPISVNDITNYSVFQMRNLSHLQFFLLNHWLQITLQALLLPPPGCLLNLGIPLCPLHHYFSILLTDLGDTHCFQSKPFLHVAVRVILLKKDANDVTHPL